MKKILLFSLSFLIIISGFSQKFQGQWKGYFIDKSTPYTGFGGEKCDYVLELEAKGNKLTGYSYTYFSEGAKHYYTICRLEGLVKPKEKYVEVREVERTKTNVPDNIRNCFQVHKLTYFKNKEGETLKGEWVPLPKQHGDCGFGVTSLNRRLLQSAIPAYNKGFAKSVPPIKKSTQLTAKVTTKHPPKLIAKIKPPVTEHLKADSLVTKIEPNKKENIVTNTRGSAAGCLPASSRCRRGRPSSSLPASIGVARRPSRPRLPATRCRGSPGPAAPDGRTSMPGRRRRQK